MLNKYLKITTVVFLHLSFLPSFAQSIENLEAQMNEIKLNETMVYGEDYNDDKNIAYQNALSELLTYANNLRTEKGKSKIKISDLQPIVREFTYSKGNRHNVLVYAPILQLLSITNKYNLEIIIQTVDNENQQNDITKNIEKQSTLGQNNINSNDSSSANDSTNILQKESSETPPYNVILETLCSQDNWNEIKGFITDFKNQGKIKETGFCTTYTEVPTDAYSILIDEMYGILSILSPKNSENRINYKTNLSDSDTNYPNCKVIVWYR